MTLWLLGALAALAVIACELPLPLSLPLALLSLGEGLRLGCRELSRPKQWLAIDADGTAAVGGQAVTDLVVAWRGPLVFVRFRDAEGRSRRLAWWPDTLAAPARRELRLAAPVQGAAQKAPSMAP